MTSVEYRFDRYRLQPAMREMWHGDRLLVVPRLVFDALTYLVEHRDRAIGRDELVAAVWGRVDVAEARVSELVLRARRAIGDDGRVQRAIRTVPGFGYRWVIATEVVTDCSSESTSPQTGDVPLVPLTSPRSQPGHAEITSPPEPVAPMPAPAAETAPKRPTSERRTSLRFGLMAIGLLFISGLTYIGVHLWSPRETPIQADQGRMLLVLPVTVDAPREAGWVRFGAMDLIADRLLSAGLPVLPSEGVLMTLASRASPMRAGDGTADIDIDDLRRRFGAGPIVQGHAVRSAGGWTLVLSTSTTDEQRHIVRAENADIILAARQAADQLAVALGHAPPVASETAAGPSVLDERLQQAKAAALAGQLDHARSLLGDLPEQYRDDPRVRFQLADLDFRAGNLDKALATYTELLDVVQASDPTLYGRTLSARGTVHFRKREFSAAIRDFDAAIPVLQSLGAVHELGNTLGARGIARLGLREFDAATADLGRARIQLQQAGDRLGLAQMGAYFGILESERKHFDQALPYLLEAADSFERLGAVERSLSVLIVTFDAQANLLRWDDALATSERQRALRTGANDMALALVIAGRRGRALLATGRNDEARRLLADAETRYSGVRPEAIRYLHDFQADLASHLDQPDAASDATDRALATWPADPSYDRYGYLVLLRQRALIASNKAIPESIEPYLPKVGASNVASAFDIARAEWAAKQDRYEDAQRLYDSALRAAQATGVPAQLVAVTVSYGNWLLGQGRTEDAATLAGGVAAWADQDYECALLQLAVFRALGQHRSWAAALRQAQALAGERTIPAPLLAPPSA